MINAIAFALVLCVLCGSAVLQIRRSEATGDLVDAVIGNGYNGLAAQNLHTVTVAEALKNGANPNARIVRTNPVTSLRDIVAWVRHDPSIFYDDYPVLDEAIGNNDVKTVERLLQHGADPNQRAIDGVTPLMCASTHDVGWHSSKMTRLLLAYGANPALRDTTGHTASSDATDLARTLYPADKVVRLLHAPNTVSHSARTRP